ncbi:maleate cis-trans isomerase family protein [Shimia abyssi]|uniref:Maleate isomerase n=1 Tax=Shimia abyssi TaxID=1662395 RepID=A0A2P8FED8_9RHOB|nr:Asp/Glu racemase [Shimia abyssi]PSL20082.1 maleate isomerase [Shimia abyssi]
MDIAPFTLTGPIGTTATLGLIVLQFDETLEQDMRCLFPTSDVALYTSRVPSGAEVTPDSLTAMEAAIPAAASLFPPAAPFGAVGYGCTSATTLIGAPRVAELVRSGAGDTAVSDPLTAALAACRALGLTRIGMVTPYIEKVSTPVVQAFEAVGVSVPAMVSFGEAGEERVARIDCASITNAALQVGQDDAIEGVFLSCTNLRTLDVIPKIEAALNKPALSSNQCLAWHMARLSGAPLAASAPGRLFAT